MRVEGKPPWESIYAPERRVRKTNADPPPGWVWSEEDDRWIIDEEGGYERDPKTRMAVKKSDVPE